MAEAGAHSERICGESDGSDAARRTVSVRPCWEEGLLALPDVDFRMDEPLARHTTFRIGGPVRCLAVPRTMDALFALMDAIRQESIPHIVLGGGSNVLAPDPPWEAVAVKLDAACTELAPVNEGSGLYVGAGVSVARLLGFCMRNGLAGLEPLTGIPGTVGGALVMNAGTAEGCTADALSFIDLLDASGERRRMERGELSPRYRSMGLPEGSMVLGACFRLERCDSGSVRARVRELMLRRKRTQPLGFPSAGCIFKNPEGSSAGALIDRAGLKGFRIGGAEVSPVHANWIVNVAGASARDVLSVVRHVEECVYERFGVRLEREIRIPWA
ncbi:MAG: UDP-N-acetylmuramate dehydrogenase [Acidobacteriota bacterium]